MISTLLLVSILVIVVLAIGITLTDSQSTEAAGRDAAHARESALFGLRTALGELQAAAGPDQRITATASVLESRLNPPNGQQSWTGVWKSDTIALKGQTPSYSPAQPNDREFVGWLVSSRDSSGRFALPSDLSAVQKPVSSGGATQGIEDHITLVSRSPDEPCLQVEKVFLDEVNRGTRYFAFCVEDEGVKADLSWSENSSQTEGERVLKLRLSAAPGPDFGALQNAENQGPFTTLQYPLTQQDERNVFLSEVIGSMRDPADLATLASGTNLPNWLADQRDDITWGSRGLLTDVKWGGLRRDLSLAFEMDGDADVTATEQPTKFNRQIGEFVGNGDRLSAPEMAKGMSVPERFLYRDFRGAGTPFSEDIFAGSNKPVRGPNWYALRDYANLYKRLKRTADGYSMQARSYYPNVSAADHWNYQYGTLMGVHSGLNTWDGERSRHGYVFKPARASYAPVLLGYLTAYSVLATNSDGVTADLALGIDPFFYLWNPYNRVLEVEKYAIRLTTFAGHATFWVTDQTGR
ncbi:MAG: hypothetical protein AAF191_16315, partial [Verrucomicrobiota bacterium]